MLVTNSDKVSPRPLAIWRMSSQNSSSRLMLVLRPAMTIGCLAIPDSTATSALCQGVIKYAARPLWISINDTHNYFPHRVAAASARLHHGGVADSRDEAKAAFRARRGMQSRTGSAPLFAVRTLHEGIGWF